MSPSPQRCRSKLGGAGNNCKLTHVHVVQRCFRLHCVKANEVWSLMPLTNSEFEFVSVVRVPDPKRGLEMKFRSESPATLFFLL